MAAAGSADSDHDPDRDLDLDRPAHDRDELVALLEEYLLGETPSLTGQQLADEVGIPYDEARLRWRSLGFAEVGPDVPAFTHADLEALRQTQHLIDLGVVEGEDQQALVRSLGRSFARLADWQMGLLARAVDPEHTSLEDLGALLDQVTPTVERLQAYVWRRHTLLAASRLALTRDRADAAERDDPVDDDPVDDDTGSVDDVVEEELDDATTLGVGFADIVGYTKSSRSLSRRELTRLVDGFEGRTLEIAVAHGGRIIKTIGDEVLFVADSPGDLARIGLELVEQRDADDDFPELRVGLAWGPTLARLGDVYGPTVNIASRLTSSARPGTVLADRALADRLGDDDALTLRRVPRVSVRGYRKLEPWAVRRA
ncbi:adenylate/guanylate cyclase domain-containing protein [Nocardioides marmoraquaticus]